MKFTVLFSLAFLLALGGRSQTRTWTFAEDGKMMTDSGEAWSFKKKGRIDAVFVRLNGTNAVLLTSDAKYRTLPLASLSEPDRSYLRRVSGASDEKATLAQAVSEQSAAATRLAEATKLRHEAAARRRLAQLSLDGADRLENEAASLSVGAGGSTADSRSPDAAANTLESSKAPSPSANEGSVAARADTELKKSGAESNLQEAAKLRRQAAEKRESAARFQSEAAELERVSRSMEPSPLTQVPVSH